jgi:hypothetical protein
MGSFLVFKMDVISSLPKFFPGRLVGLARFLAAKEILDLTPLRKRPRERPKMPLSGLSRPG